VTRLGYTWLRLDGGLASVECQVPFRPMLRATAYECRWWTEASTNCECWYPPYIRSPAIVAGALMPAMSSYIMRSAGGAMIAFGNWVPEEHARS